MAIFAKNIVLFIFAFRKTLSTLGDLMGEDEDKSLHLKGQMMFMAEWGVIMFLSSPILSDLDSLKVNGLYVNDLPMHDFSRDLLFVGMNFYSSSMT